MPTIRPATPQDRDAVWRIFRAIVAEGTTYAYPADLSRAAGLQRWMEAPRACYVAEQEGRVVGTYYLEDNQPGRGAHVCNAGYMVQAGARGQGIGRRMCEHSLAEARQFGYRAMQYNLVVATNKAAIHLWKGMGFAIVGTLPEAFDHPEQGLVDAYVMYRQL